MAPASLTGLPLELLVHLIATYLPTKDFGALRLSNKYLERVLFDTFAKEFFTKKQFMLSTASLQTLVSISRHGAFNKTLRYVIIGLESFDTTDLSSLFSTMSPAQYNAFQKGSADQFALSSSGRDRALLTEAFRNLQNLDTVGIRDYEASGRVRDDDRWRSYGAPSISQEIGFNLHTGSATFASQAFLLLMQALVDADHPVSAIETILRTRNAGHIAGLKDSAFFLGSPNPKMDVVLGGLRQLLLTLNPSDGLRDSRLDAELHSTCLELFLLRCSFLEHLRMNFYKPLQYSPSWVLERLCKTPDLLPVIRRLDLGMLTIMPDVLIKVISKFAATLRHVSLWKVELQWDDATQWKDFDDRYDPWPRVLKDLAMTMSLTNISLGCLSQRDRTDYIGYFEVKFSGGKIAQAYSGDKRVWMPLLLDQLVVERPKPPSDLSDLDEDADEDEE
ncbi:uncharacterized protein CC84DRAFT_1159122 [Paraphaeosphaeria sporulosa]|uniref:Uncharacterized protein n=1 Tax=Paraphaeosphaeria sporulosa TaxID=1460663 RepID=A0A177CXU3_9PLEO|nr:uncharacterized protein CC84DRAFT_1159122 [Paraphaeosphaeria sporulosa]OAG11647.1 hypothetical protein CC84DRAFT_1159122 [Paraphaeosphaeria sporulosa]